jgi:hypothetical protein
MQHAPLTRAHDPHSRRCRSRPSSSTACVEVQGVREFEGSRFATRITQPEATRSAPVPLPMTVTDEREDLQADRARPEKRLGGVHSATHTQPAGRSLSRVRPSVLEVKCDHRCGSAESQGPTECVSTEHREEGDEAPRCPLRGAPEAETIGVNSGRTATIGRDASRGMAKGKAALRSSKPRARTIHSGDGERHNTDTGTVTKPAAASTIESRSPRRREKKRRVPSLAIRSLPPRLARA